MPHEMERTRREERGLESQRRPTPVLERFADEMDRIFDDFGLGRGWFGPRTGRSWLTMPSARADWGWMPEVEVFQRNSELVIRADLPGLKKEDVKVDVTEDRVTLQGERKREHEEEREGVYRSERSYGTFYRDVVLPPGTMSDQAKATFKDGVLEITMPAPPESARRGRRLEISEGSAGRK